MDTREAVEEGCERQMKNFKIVRSFLLRLDELSHWAVIAIGMDPNRLVGANLSFGLLRFASSQPQRQATLSRTVGPGSSFDGWVQPV